MDIFSNAEGFERLFFVNRPDVGLKMIIAIHDRTLGPALGGIRIFNYDSEKDMIIDSLRLARGMTYKNAIMRIISNGRLSYGGGKSVVWGDAKTVKTRDLLLTVAEAINELDNEYIGGADMGIRPQDIETMYERTKFIAGLQETHFRGGRRGSGDPSPITALGVFEGIRVCLKRIFKNDYLGNKTFAIQGVGKVGMALLEYLNTRNAKSIAVTDTDESRLQIVKASYPSVKIIPPEEEDKIYDEECDVFTPNAIGGIINDETLPRLKCRIIAGGANNQLLEPKHGKELLARGILYAPDYVINAGGVINVASELESGGYDHGKATFRARGIAPMLERIFLQAQTENLPPEVVADRIAEEEIQKNKTRN